MSTTERGPLPREGWVDVGAANPVAMPSRSWLWFEFFLCTFLVSAWVSIGVGVSSRAAPLEAALLVGFFVLVLRLVLNGGALARVVVLRALFVSAFAMLTVPFVVTAGAVDESVTVWGLLLTLVGLPIVFSRFVPWQRSQRFTKTLRAAALTAVGLSALTASLGARGDRYFALFGTVVGALYLASAWRHRPSAARARWREGTFSPDTGLCVDDARLDASLVPAHYVGPVVVELPDTALRGAYRDGAARPTAVIAGTLTNVEYLLTDRYDVSLARALAVALVCAAPALGHLLRQLAR